MSQPTPDPAPTAPSEPAAAAPTATPTPGDWDGNVESLPADVQKMIRDLRSEAASSRTNAKATAAKEAEDAVTQKIAQALGFAQGPMDPAVLTAQLEAKDGEARQARVALAIYQAAPSVGADPAALLDSSSFLAKVKDLDPSDTAGIAAVIGQAVQANPRLGAATSTTPTGPRAPRPDPSQASGANGAAPAGPAAELAAIIQSQMPGMRA